MTKYKSPAKKASKKKSGKSVSGWPKKLEDGTNLGVPLPPNSKSEVIGQKRIDDKLFVVLKDIWQYQVTTKSDFAREFADFIAMAASMGLISTRITESVYGRQWQITARGLVALEDYYGLHTNEDEPELPL